MFGTFGWVWHAMSPLGLLLGGSGLILLVVAALGLLALPAWLSRPAIVAGAVLLAAGALYQTAYVRATVAAELRQVEASAAAERTRAELAEAISADLKARAERDRAALTASNRRLQELSDALDKNPAGDRVCVPRDLSRRLRDL